jgi:hypothetical protein
MITESGSRQLFIARLSGDEEDASQSRFVRLNLTAHLAPPGKGQLASRIYERH